VDLDETPQQFRKRITSLSWEAERQAPEDTSPTEHAAIAIYREALQDLTDTCTDPDTISIIERFATAKGLQLY
jgi:hypothetical protein